MLHTQGQNSPQPETPVIPKSRNYKVTPIATTILSRNAIQERAFEIYESRGRLPGQDVQDWLRAEQEIVERAD